MNEYVFLLIAVIPFGVLVYYRGGLLSGPLCLPYACYDFGTITHPDLANDPAWEGHPQVLPQAHTYAFRSYEDAMQHPEAMKWKKDHAYRLQKVYLN